MPGAKRTEQRLARIKSRLSDGFSVEQLKAVVVGVQKDDWLMGRDPKSRTGGYTGIETIYRDAEQVERLVALAQLEDEEFDCWQEPPPIENPDPPGTEYVVAPPPEFQVALDGLGESQGRLR